MKGQVLRAAPRWAAWPTDRQPARITYSVTGQGARLSPVASAEQIVAVDIAVCLHPVPSVPAAERSGVHGVSPLGGSPWRCQALLLLLGFQRLSWRGSHSLSGN